MNSAIRWTEEKLQSLASDEAALALYHAREDSLHERANMINSAREEGRMEGWIEGEMEKALPIAQNLLTAGMDLETIAKMTELERSQIETLQQISQN